MKKISLKKKRQQNISHNYATGLAITIVMFVLILIGMLWTPYDPDTMQGSLKLKGPSLLHWFGTDQFGRDVLSRV